MDFEKIYKILIEIVADQNEVEIETRLKRKEDSYEKSKMGKCCKSFSIS